MLLKDMEAGKYRPNVLHGHKLDNPDKGSLGYFRVVPADHDVENQLQAMLKGTNDSIKQLESVVRRADALKTKLQRGQAFFDDNIRGQAYLMLHFNRMLNLLTRAYLQREDKPTRALLLEQSAKQLDLAETWLRKAEHGRFTDWYKHDRGLRCRAAQGPNSGACGPRGEALI